MTAINVKQQVAVEAVKLVKEGMIIGLGTGSTANYFIEELARINQQGGINFFTVSSSVTTTQYALKHGLKFVAIEHVSELDLYVDGADEVSPELYVLKGRGQDLVKEKLLANAARDFIVLVDDSKLVNKIDDNYPIPIEVMPMAQSIVIQQLQQLGGKGGLRVNDAGGVATSAAGNTIIDMAFDMPATYLNERLNAIPGIVEHGLFIDLASVVLVGNENGVTMQTNRAD